MAALHSYYSSPETFLSTVASYSSVTPSSPVDGASRPDISSYYSIVTAGSGDTPHAAYDNAATVSRPYDTAAEVHLAPTKDSTDGRLMTVPDMAKSPHVGTYVDLVTKSVQMSKQQSQVDSNTLTGISGPILTDIPDKSSRNWNGMCCLVRWLPAREIFMSHMVVILKTNSQMSTRPYTNSLCPLHISWLNALQP